jgi:hypothetical protein
MSEARVALPSSRIFAPSLIIGYRHRSRISWSEICRRSTPAFSEKPRMMSSTSLDGVGLRFSS